MSMDNPIIPLALAMLLYAWVAYGYFSRESYGTALAWFSYALANSGFITAILLKEIK